MLTNFTTYSSIQLPAYRPRQLALHIKRSITRDCCRSRLFSLVIVFLLRCDPAYQASILACSGDHLQNGSPYAIRPLFVCPVLSVTLVYCGQTVGWIKIQDEPWNAGIGLSPGHILPARKEAQQPPHSKFTGAGFACVHIIEAHNYCGQTAG